MSDVDTQRRGPGRPTNAEIAARDAQQAQEGPAKRVRKPFGGRRQKLAYDQRPGYHRHWFNDVLDRIREAEEAGYEHVKDSAGKNVSRIVGSSAKGDGIVAYLMEIPIEWYQEDQAAKAARVDEVEQSMRRGTVQGIATPGVDGIYVPSEGIKISR